MATWASDHHERLDGSGYPIGKTAATLSLPSRIVVVADTYDALREKRSYKASYSRDAALATLRKGVHRKFDAGALDCLRRVLLLTPFR